MILFLLLIFSVPSFAIAPLAPEECPLAPPTSDPAFCESFKSIAFCHCKIDSPNKSICGSVKKIYDVMLATFHTQERACKYQADNGSEKRATSQECMADWDCYWKGGASCYRRCE